MAIEPAVGGYKRVLERVDHPLTASRVEADLREMRCASARRYPTQLRLAREVGQGAEPDVVGRRPEIMVPAELGLVGVIFLRPLLGPFIERVEALLGATRGSPSGHADAVPLVPGATF